MDLSARWLLTVLCGMAFVLAVWASILARFAGKEPILTGVEVMAILMLVFQSYFMRSDRKNGGT